MPGARAKCEMGQEFTSAYRNGRRRADVSGRMPTWPTVTFLLQDTCGRLRSAYLTSAAGRKRPARRSSHRIRALFAVLVDQLVALHEPGERRIEPTQSILAIHETYPRGIRYLRDLPHDAIPKIA